MINVIGDVYMCSSQEGEGRRGRRGRGREKRKEERRRGGEGDKRNKERKGRGEKKRAFHANLAQSPGIMRKGGYGGGV